MSNPLTHEEKESYTRIIDGILAAADLETVTRKKVRKGLEEAINKDLGDQKDAIKALIEARFDAISNEVEQVPTPTSGAATEHETNGRSSSADGEIEVSLPPPGKKPKREASSSEEADARLAAELQAQENRLSRGRVTRGGAAGASNKPKSKAKPTKKKTPKRVRSDDDSNVEDSEAGAAEPKKRKTGGGFQKPFNLSVPLAELCGESQLSRPQVVKKIWEYIKGNELQDPTDKRQIMCDEKLHAVFKQDKVNMFSMNKLLGSQLYPIED
ncbi:SWIB-domain-containing protein [Parathielavia hyrcaniae]|uniref:SWIB-domain-containing protein n=1 Tax=Parathielavia hyrcaniae TaxID=113614 RepID=A0AAN6PWC5_9PEZI|nr:SWIB-domain-containing protein [Parathielavia hyrcaniae]